MFCIERKIHNGAEKIITLYSINNKLQRILKLERYFLMMCKIRL
jgi:hypothetical protein